jgi:hypothetical protein
MTSVKTKASVTMLCAVWFVLTAPFGNMPQTVAGGANDAYSPSGNNYPPPRNYDDSYRPRGDGGSGGDAYSGGAQYDPPPSDGGGYGEPYSPPRRGENYGDGDGYPEPQPPPRDYDSSTYSQSEIVRAGHGFFGSISKGLASVIEYAFRKQGRPNGYILGEDAGGAFIAGLRYGEGRLYTKDAGTHKVYWQGPSVGYDFGGEGAKTMVLVYNLRDPSDIYHRFGGVEGSAYLVGGVSIQFQEYGDVILAPIRAGVGLRLGANVGYLKYSRKPTWNPF